MKNLLIVSPRFPPVNAPDHQRIRMSLPYFREFGWNPTVLCVNQRDSLSDGVIDENLMRTVPNDLSIKTVTAWKERRVGFRHLAFRCLSPIYRGGIELLQSKKFDLVYFSTTVFNVVPFGVLWKRKFGVPFVVDIQDPWYPGSEKYYTRKTAPGGLIKYSLVSFSARFLERWTLKRCSHVISVSNGYVDTLTARYPDLDRKDFTTLPFGAPEKDFEILPSLQVTQSVFNPHDGKRHWVYIGRGGPDMWPALRMLFNAIRQQRAKSPEIWANVQLNFVGTNYSPASRTFDVVKPLADECEVGDLVDEHSKRLPYFEALQIMKDADALLIIGSSSSEYTASKLFPYLLAHRPLLVLCHNESLMAELIRDDPQVFLATFHNDSQNADPNGEIVKGLENLISLDKANMGVHRSPLLDDYSARVATATQCQVFDQVVDSN